MMRNRFWLLGFAVVALALGVGLEQACVHADEEERLPEGAPTPRPEGEGWIDLLSAENAGHWKNVTDPRAERVAIEDGIFHVFGEKPTNYIAWTGRAFSDFELHAEVKVTPGANSGVFFRTAPDNPVQGGMEVQVYDDHGKAPSKAGTGGLYDVATPMFNMARPAGEWNSYDITCKGSLVEVRVNGWKVLDLDLAQLTMPIGKFDTPLADLPHEGHVILQDHGDEVWFRNVMVKPL